MFVSICQTSKCVKERQTIDKLVQETMLSNVFNVFDVAVSSESFPDYTKNKGRRNYYVKKSAKNQTEYETRKFIQDNRRRCPECVTYWDRIHNRCPCCRLPLKKSHYE